jgi:hypothetical protein
MAALSSSLDTSTLSSVQLEAVAALATGNSVLATAELAGVHRATIHNWLNLPEFRDALEHMRQDVAAHLDAQVRRMADLAIDAIRQILTDPNASPSVKLKAALAVLDRPLFPKPVAAAPDQTEDPPAFLPAQPAACVEIARNALCPCGSGIKYKRCCGANAPPKLCHAA